MGIPLYTIVYGIGERVNYYVYSWYCVQILHYLPQKSLRQNNKE